MAAATNTRPMSFQMKQLKMISKIVSGPAAVRNTFSSAMSTSDFSALNRAQSLLTGYSTGARIA